MYRILVLYLVVKAVRAEYCPNGGIIFAHGITPQGRRDALDAHNEVRLLVANGRVPNQPAATNLNRLYYDYRLERLAGVVSHQCKMQHVQVYDWRWQDVGQNIYIEYHSSFRPEQNWKAAVYSWFYEYADYAFGYGSKNGKEVSHYTQMMWAETRLIGCDFVLFYIPYNKYTPYGNMYTCSYGPAGNYNGETPYKTHGINRCRNLC